MSKRARKPIRKFKPSKVGTQRKPPRPEPGTAREGGIEVIARGCLIHGSSVLLCRNLKHGYLYLPGGHVEFGESAKCALAREFVEECGVRVSVGEFALASEGTFATKKRRHHEINLVFHVEPIGGGKPTRDGRAELAKVKSREPGIEFEWIDLAAVVDLDIRPTAAKAWLTTLVGQHHGQADWVTEIE